MPLANCRVTLPDPPHHRRFKLLALLGRFLCTLPVAATRALWAIALSSDVRVQQWTLQLAYARSKQRLIQKLNAGPWPTSWPHFTLSGTQSIFEF